MEITDLILFQTLEKLQLKIQILLFYYTMEAVFHTIYPLFLIIIKDLFGKELKKQDIGNQPPGEYKKDISLEEFSAGTYIIEIQGNNYSYISKINKF